MTAATATTATTAATASDVGIDSFTPDGWSPQREESVVAGLTAALPSLRMAELFAARRDMFRHADVITVATRVGDGAAVGALASRWVRLDAGRSGRTFLYILSQFVGEDYQRGSTFRRSWDSHLGTIMGTAGEFPGLFALKTYNPVAYCAIRTWTRIPDVTVYPDVTLAQQSAAATELAVLVAHAIAAGYPFDPATGVIRGIGWPRDLYPTRPGSRDAAVNAYFAAHTQPGDRVLTILEVPTARAAQAILAALTDPSDDPTTSTKPSG